VQEYTTILVDDSMREPVDGVTQSNAGLTVNNDGNIVLNGIILQNGSNLITQSGIALTI